MRYVVERLHVDYPTATPEFLTGFHGAGFIHCTIDLSHAIQFETHGLADNAVNECRRRVGQARQDPAFVGTCFRIRQIRLDLIPMEGNDER